MSRERATDVVAEMVANVIAVSVEVGDTVALGDQVLLLESMKMEIPVIADQAGRVDKIRVGVGDVIQEGDILLTIVA